MIGLTELFVVVLLLGAAIVLALMAGAIILFWMDPRTMYRAFLTVTVWSHKRLIRWEERA